MDHGSGFVGNQKRKSKDQAAADGKTNKDKAIAQQIELLTLKKEHIENLISLAREIRSKGAGTMSFDAFDTKIMEEYAEKAKASWGTTQAYKEYEEKSKGRTRENVCCRW